MEINSWSNNFSDSVASLSEKELIKEICKWFEPQILPSPFGPGDDCAVLDLSQIKGKLLSTNDAVILGKHFTPQTSGYDAGKKLINRNVSDIASMGGLPLYAMTSAIIAPEISLKWLEDFCKGMKDAAKVYDIKFIGGDLSKGENKFFSMHLTLLGSAQKPLLRTGAAPEDSIFVTGKLGASFESGKHLHFTPKIEEGLFLASANEVSSCTDLSDGLASDLRNLIPENCCAEIFADKIPLCDFPKNTIKKALTDGEDYELLFTANSSTDFIKKYTNALGYAPYEIGKIKIAENPEEISAIILKSEKTSEILKAQGFSHF